MVWTVPQIDFNTLMDKIDESIRQEKMPKWWLDRYPTEALNLDNKLAWKEDGGMSVKDYAKHQWDTFSYGFRKSCYYSPEYHRSLINYKWGGTVYLGTLSIHKKYGYNEKSWIIPPPLLYVVNKNYSDDSDTSN